MMPPPTPQKNLKLAALVAPCFLPWTSLDAQDISTLVSQPNPFTTGIFSNSSFQGGFEGGVTGGRDLKGGFTLTPLMVDTIYNSNINQSEDDVRSEQTTSFSSGLNYISDPEGGAPVVFTAGYVPQYNTYARDPDLNKLNNSGNFGISISGSRTSINVYGGVYQRSGADRLAEEFTNSTLYSLGVSGSYQLAPRTSLNAGVSMSKSEFSSGNSVGSDVLSANVGALWAATEAFSLGPLASYSHTQSSNIGVGETWGLSVQSTYTMADKVTFAGSLGWQIADYSREQGSSSGSLIASLSSSTSYPITELLSWNNSLNYGTVASPSRRNYVVHNYAYVTSLERDLLFGSVSAGLSLNYSIYEEVGPVVSDRENDLNLDLFLSYQREILDRLSVSATVTRAFNDGNRNWDQFTVGAGLQLQF